MIADRQGRRFRNLRISLIAASNVISAGPARTNYGSC